MRFSFIYCERDEYPITALCRAMQVARSGYHAWVVRKECERLREDRVLAVHVAAAFERSRRTYEESLPYRTTVVQARACRTEQARSKVSSTRSQRKWVTDVKYIRTNAGWLYLAPVIDLFSRRVVGCAMSTEQDGKLSIAALASAVETRGASKCLMIHSDRGGIYGDQDYLDKIGEIGIKRSMSRTSNPWDNAVIESFFSTLHFELLSRTRFNNQEDAQQSITEWIDNFYNSQRRHTTIGNTPPHQLRIGLPSAQAKDIINLSTKVEQAHFRKNHSLESEASIAATTSRSCSSVHVMNTQTARNPSVVVGGPMRNTKSSASGFQLFDL